MTPETFAQIDDKVRGIAAVIVAASPSVAELRARAAEYRAAGHYWLAGENADLADAIEIDPRREAIRRLIADARSGRDSLALMLFTDYQREICQ